MNLGAYGLVIKLYYRSHMLRCMWGEINYIKPLQFLICKKKQIFYTEHLSFFILSLNIFISNLYTKRITHPFAHIYIRLLTFLNTRYTHNMGPNKKTDKLSFLIKKIRLCFDDMAQFDIFIVSLWVWAGKKYHQFFGNMFVNDDDNLIRDIFPKRSCFIDLGDAWLLNQHCGVLFSG